VGRASRTKDVAYFILTRASGAKMAAAYTAHSKMALQLNIKPNPAADGLNTATVSHVYIYDLKTCNLFLHLLQT
jgi:hypothetical protein